MPPSGGDLFRQKLSVAWKFCGSFAVCVSVYVFVQDAVRNVRESYTTVCERKNRSLDNHRDFCTREIALNREERGVKYENRSAVVYLTQRGCVCVYSRAIRLPSASV